MLIAERYLSLISRQGSSSKVEIWSRLPRRLICLYSPKDGELILFISWIKSVGCDLGMRVVLQINSGVFYMYAYTEWPWELIRWHSISWEENIPSCSRFPSMTPQSGYDSKTAAWPCACECVHMCVRVCAFECVCVYVYEQEIEACFPVHTCVTMCTVRQWASLGVSPISNHKHTDL